MYAALDLNACAAFGLFRYVQGFTAAAVGHGPDQPFPDGWTAFLIGGAQFDIHAFRRAVRADFLECFAQLAGILGQQELSAGFFGHAAQLFSGRFSLCAFKTKADGMNGQANAQLTESLRCCTGVVVAGFLAIGDQNDRGFVLSVLELFRPWMTASVMGVIPLGMML